ncbi:Protein SIX6OS1 [Camelus dromedarius]|uniref:Protein SIX6OS1 n=1 Tax=Camelus dromedarius TaxID=9838 RepID=A0A5N4E2F2_CAMDR|nr:Protein SIX6OS1 [Camelus dromedarius]
MVSVFVTRGSGRKMYHDYICQYKDVLKQYQLKYSETLLSREYCEKKKEHEEIQNRLLACTEQLKMNETIFMEFLVPAPFPSLTNWTLHMYPHFYLEFLLDKYYFYILIQIARLYEMKTLSETMEEKSKNTEKRKELKERIFEKDEQHVLTLNKTPQNSQLFLPYESQKLVRPIKMHSSEPRVTDKKEKSSVKQSKLANIDFGQKENDTQVNAECGDKGTVKQLRESKYTSQFSVTLNLQVIYAEHFGNPIESNSDEVEERPEIFPQTPEIPLFLRTPEAVKTPESVEKLPKTPSFEM